MKTLSWRLELAMLVTTFLSCGAAWAAEVQSRALNIVLSSGPLQVEDVDLNGDGVADLRLIIRCQDIAGQVGLGRIHTVDVVGMPGAELGQVAVQWGQVIGPELAFLRRVNLVRIETHGDRKYHLRGWSRYGGQRAYLPVRLSHASDTHYGWMLIDVWPNGRGRIEAVGMGVVGGAPVLAGRHHGSHLPE